MKWVCICVLFIDIIGESYCKPYSDNEFRRSESFESSESHIGNGLQIGIADDTSFTLHKENLMKLKTMLEEDDVKDRELVVVSIAGELKAGKSFLMNFFIRYLEYNENGNETDWMRKNELMNGFDWGMQRTNGISVWKKIFKRTLPNGTKVAIVLIDTQGLYSIKNQSFNKDARIYAFSAMSSSVQCYNVFRDFNALDLGALDLFSGYGSFANEKPNPNKQFQNLNIIVRDKMKEHSNMNYGRQSEHVKDEYLSVNLKDTTVKEEQSKRISKIYYEHIDLFYLPSPDVPKEFIYDGNLTKVDPSFIGNVTNLAESLFPPQNLVVKTIAGDAMKAKDFISYLETYGEMLNSNKLPDLKTYFQNILDNKYKKWQEEGFNVYKTSMEAKIQTCDPTNNVSYLFEDELWNIHNQFKNKSMEKFSKHTTLNTDEYILTYAVELENKIDHEFNVTFITKNKHNKNCYKANVKSFYEKLVKNLTHTYDDRITKEIGNGNNSFDESAFDEMRQIYIRNATQEFDAQNKYKNDPKYEKEIAERFKRDLGINIRDLFHNAEQRNRLYQKLIESRKSSSVAIRCNFDAMTVFVVITILNSSQYST